MRRFGLLLSIIGFLVLGIAAPGMDSVTRAQGVTPVAGIEPEGVLIEPLAITSGVTLAKPADIIALRLSIGREPASPWRRAIRRGH